MKKTLVGEGDLGDFRARLAYAYGEYQTEFETDPKFLTVSQEDTMAFLRLPAGQIANMIGWRQDRADEAVKDFLVFGVGGLRKHFPSILGTRAVWNFDGPTAFMNAIELEPSGLGDQTSEAPRRILILYFTQEKTRDDHQPIIGDNTDNVLGYYRVEECFGTSELQALDHAVPLPGEMVLNTVYARDPRP